MPTDNSNAFSPQDLTRTEDQNKVFPNARGQVVPAIESAPEEPQDWQTPMSKPGGGWEQGGTPLTFEPRPNEVNKIINSKHVLSDVDTSDPSNARVFVANFLNSKYDEDKRGIYKDYEGKTKAYGLSGDPVADAKSILDGDTKTHESSQTRIAKDRKVIAEGLDKLGYEERQSFGANAKNTFDRGFLDLGVGTAAQGTLKGIESMGDEMERIERGLFEDMGITYYDEELGGPLTSEDVQKWREDVRERNTVDPEFLSSYTGGIIQGYGQAAAIVPAFLLNPALGTGMSVAQAYQYGEDGYRDFVKSKGITYEESEARKAGLWNMPSAAVDVIANRFAIGKILKPLKGAKVTKGGALEFLKDTAESAAMGSGTEGVQTVWENLNAKYLSGYDRDKVLTDGVVDAMVIGAFVDSTITAGGQGVTKGVNKLLGKTMDPVEGMSAVDWALTLNVVPEAEFAAQVEREYGDEVTEDGVPLAELAWAARGGDRKAAQALADALTLEVSAGAKEAGLTPAEAEARGKEAAEVADPVEPLVETAIDREINAKKEELAALEGAEESTPEDMKVGEKLDKEIQSLETKRDENQRPVDVLSAQAREEAAAEEAGLLTRRAEEEIEIDKAEEVADAIDFFEQRSRGGVTKDYKPDTRKGGETLIKQMRRAGMSKEEIAAKSLQIMTEAGRPHDRLSDQVVRGEQTSNSKAGNDFRATVKLYKDADPMDVAEEYIHAETDREVNEGTINYEDIAAYRKQVESITSGEDTRGDTEGDHKEWIAEQVKARLLGNRHDTRLPESFARFIDRIISRLRNLFTRANELIELEAQGMLPDGFVELLDRLGSMDDDALMQSIQAEQVAETASDPKDELLEVMKRNKLSVPRPDSDPSHRGELETYFEGIGKKWKYLKKGGSLDSLREGLQAAGFNVDTPSDVLDLLDRSARGEAIYANTDSRSAAQQTADETFSLAPDTPAFKEWFGDSKVVDENGDPLVVYHGTTSEFEAFDLSQDQVSGDVGKLGFFFTNDTGYANAYASEGYPQRVPAGGSVMPVYLSIKNPKRESLDTMQDMEMDFTPSEVEAYGRSLQESGYDGIIFKGEGGIDEIVAFNPTQIKSATGNRGTFDPNDPRISYSLEPLSEQDAYGKAPDSLMGFSKDQGNQKGFDDTQYRTTIKVFVGGDFMDEIKGLNQAHAMERARRNWEGQTVEFISKETDPRISYSLEPLSEQDAEYLSAVESGDTETAQAMVDEAAKAAGYDSDKLHHGSAAKEIESFDRDRWAGGTIGDGFYFTPEEKKAKTYSKMGLLETDTRHMTSEEIDKAGKVYDVYLKIKNPLVIESYSDIPMGVDWGKMLEDGGYDGVHLYENGKLLEIAVRNPEQIKSADPVTYDANGEVIPLSERFDPTRDEINYSLEPLFEQDADAIVTERTEEIQSRTPERQAFIDYQRELRKTQLDNTEEEKAKLQKLLQLATDADEIEALKQAGDEKIIRVVEQKVKQIRKQAAEREDVTESVKALERLINSPEVPMEVRARMRGFGRLAERKTPQGKARWVEQMANKLEAEIDRHYRTRNVRTLRSLLRPFATEYAPNRRKLRERVGEEARADLNFAQRLLNNSEATPPEGMTDERRDELVDIFGDVGNRQSNPTRVKAALEIAGSIAKGGRTARDEFKDQRRERNEQVGDLVREEVLNGEEAMGKSQIAAREKQRNAFKKGYDYMRSRLIRGMEGFQQQLNKMDSVKGGILEDLFLPAVYQADQNEKALNREHVERVNEDFKTVLGTDNRQAASWYENSHELHDTDIEWIEDRAIGMEKRTISKQQGVALFMQWLDPSLRSTFFNMGINESTIEQVKEFIGEIGVSEAYYFRERYAEMGIKLNAKHMEVEGIPLDMIDGYGGRARRINSVGSRQEDMQMFSTNSSGRPTVKSGSMKERTNSTDYLIFQDAAMDFSAHAKEVNHYISHAELAKNLSAAFLNNARARNAITQKHGADFYDALKAQVEYIIEGNPIVTNKIHRDMDKLRSNVTKAQLMVKPAILVKQLTSAPAFIEEIGPVAYAKAAASLTRNARKFMPMIWGSEYVKNRMSNSQFADIQQQLDQRDNTLKGLRWDDYAMMNVKWGDIGAVIAGGAPVYVHAYNEAKAAGMTNDQAQAKAEEVFGIASERAQQSSAGHAKGAFLREEGIMRTWFMYLTSPLQYQRNVNTGIANLVANVFEKKAGRKSDVKKAANQALRAIVIYHVILPQIFQAVASGLVGFTDDEDYIKEQFFAKQRRALYMGNLNAFPVIGALISKAANLVAGTGENFDSSGSPLLDLVQETTADFYKALKNGDSLDAWLDLGESASLVLGIPAKTVKSYYEAFTDISEGNTENPLLRALGWSKWSIFED